MSKNKKFTVIECDNSEFMKQKERKLWFKDRRIELLYRNARSYLLKFLDNDMSEDKDFIKKMIYYNATFLAMNRAAELSTVKTHSDIERVVNWFFMTLHAISFLTIDELISIFPIGKDFKGKKYGIKDYFYAKEQISKIQKDKPLYDIGSELIELLPNLNNNTLMTLSIGFVMASNLKRKMEGKMDIMEECFGLKPVKIFTDEKDRLVMHDTEKNTLTVLKKKRPRYLREID